MVLDAVTERASRAGRGPGRAVELQGGQVRVVQRRDQRLPQADVHDPAVLAAAGRTGDGHPAAHLPADQRPGHRRVRQLRARPGRSRRSRRGRLEPTAPTAWPRPTSDAPRSSARASSAGCARTSATSSVTTRTTSRPMRGPGFSSGTPNSTCTRWTLSIAAATYRRRRGWGCATSPNAAPKYARQGIKITDNAIIPLKERAADRSNGRLAWLGLTIRRRHSSEP